MSNVSTKLSTPFQPGQIEWDDSKFNYDKMIESWDKERCLDEYPELGGIIGTKSVCASDHTAIYLPEYKGNRIVRWCLFCKTLFIGEEWKEIPIRDYVEYRRQVQNGIFE